MPLHGSPEELEKARQRVRREAELDANTIETVLVDRITGNLVPADDIDSQTVTVRESDGAVLGEGASADGQQSRVVVKEPGPSPLHPAITVDRGT